MKNELNFYSEKYYFKTWKGRRWLRLVYQNTPSEGFLNEDEALFSMNPSKYSILSELNDALKYNGSFEFHLEYPAYKIHWSQKDNPVLIYDSALNNGEVDDLVVFQNKTDGIRFTGLARSDVQLNNKISVFLDGTHNSSWWYAVCMYNEVEPYWKETGIPGAKSEEKWMSLWVRVPNYFGVFRTHCVSKRISYILYFISLITMS